jgi:hypothetical protein
MDLNFQLEVEIYINISVWIFFKSRSIRIYKLKCMISIYQLVV